MKRSQAVARVADLPLHVVRLASLTTGAIAAVLGDLGVPEAIMRGFAVVSRSAGLVAHLKEEEEQQVAAHLTQFAENDVKYVNDRNEPLSRINGPSRCTIDTSEYALALTAPRSSRC